MRKQHLLILSAGALAAVILAFVWRDTAPARPRAPADTRIVKRLGQPAVEAPRAARRIEAPRAAARIQRGPAPEMPPRSNAESEPRDDAPSIGLDAYPSPAELSEVHPDLPKAYRRAYDEARAEFLMAAQRRCMLLLPSDTELIEWDTLETFEPDGSGRAVLTDLELVPRYAGQNEFFACLSEAMVGEVAMQLPSDYDDEVEVTNSQRIIMGAAPTQAAAEREVAALHERLTDDALSDAQRTVLADHLSLWECYAERGPSGRRACLEESVAR